MSSFRVIFGLCVPGRLTEQFCFIYKLFLIIPSFKLGQELTKICALAMSCTTLHTPKKLPQKSYRETKDKFIMKNFLTGQFVWPNLN